MKKIMTIGALSILLLVGCEKKSVSLEEFYLDVINSNIKAVSLEECKDKLEDFEYKYEEIKHSKESIEEYKEEFGEEPEVSNFSSNIFIDENKNEIDIFYNETKKEIDQISYLEYSEEGNKKMSQDKNGSCTVNIITLNTKAQLEMINRLLPSRSSSEVIKGYFDLVDRLQANSNLSLEEGGELLKLEYKKTSTSEVLTDVGPEELDVYTFEKKDDKSYMTVYVKDNIITNTNLHIAEEERGPYIIMIQTTEEDHVLQVTMFEFENKGNDKELYNFIYNEGTLKY